MSPWAKTRDLTTCNINICGDHSGALHSGRTVSQNRVLFQRRAVSFASPSYYCAMPQSTFIGTAGWNIRRDMAERFPPTGTHLQRYATRLCAAEINSSFYRQHRKTTYARWADSVPSEFRFSVKMPKQVTHELRLNVPVEVVENFLAEVSGLGEKLGCLLVQLPPSLPFDPHIASAFFTSLRRKTTVAIVCEPRHAMWFTPHAEDLLREHRVGRVAADPALVPRAAVPGGWLDTVYYRLHGSPRTYYSAYDADYLANLARQIREATAEATWCIFDNTALGAATENALQLLAKITP